MEMQISRSPESLREIVADVLSTEPYSDVVSTPMDAGPPKRRPLNTPCNYQATAWLDEAQLKELNEFFRGLSLRHFLWNDPLDGIDKLVIFERAPEVLNDISLSDPTSRRTQIRFTFIYSKETAAEQARLFSP